MKFRKAITVLELINEFLLALHSTLNRWDEIKHPEKDLEVHT